MTRRTALTALLIAASMGIIAAAAWHSVEEIHYLKTFYPDRFTVQEAFYASGVELIKVTLIAFPLLVLIRLALSIINRLKP